MNIKPKTIKECLVCSKKFQVYPYMLRAGNGKYCSVQCSSLNNKTKIKKGQRLSKETEFKKGTIPWNLGMEYTEEIKEKISATVKAVVKSGEEHHSWKGNRVGYSGLHYWVNLKLGKPSRCEHCNKTKGKFEWANKSHTYKRLLSDWIRLCVSCHQKYDETSRNRERNLQGRFI